MHLDFNAVHFHFCNIFKICHVRQNMIDKHNMETNKESFIKCFHHSLREICLENLSSLPITWSWNSTWYLTHSWSCLTVLIASLQNYIILSRPWLVKNLFICSTELFTFSNIKNGIYNPWKFNKHFYIYPCQRDSLGRIVGQVPSYYYMSTPEDRPFKNGNQFYRVIKHPAKK